MDTYTATEEAYKNGYEKGRQDAMKWIPVTERLPEDGNERVLVKVDFCNILVGNPKIDTDRYDLGMWVRYGSHITHWMPLPPAPKEE